MLVFTQQKSDLKKWFILLYKTAVVMSSILSYIIDYFWFISIAELQKAQKLQVLANSKNSNVKFVLIKTLNLLKVSLKFPF